MIEPNFCEGQLQQLVNSSITYYLYGKKNLWINPIIISLNLESELGWDTGFYFPWLPIKPNINYEGCNFFIQYKLSKILEGPRAGEWYYWQQPYLRFKIPYPSKVNGRYVSDYHQFDALKVLSDQNYPVYYSTNHIVFKNELLSLSSNQNLLDEIPFLDLKDVNNRHEKVTFTENSNYFLLHSNNEKYPTIKWKVIHSILSEQTFNSLHEDNNKLFEILLEKIIFQEFHKELLTLYRRLDEIKLDFREQIKYYFLSLSFFKHSGIFLFRYLPSLRDKDNNVL